MQRVKKRRSNLSLSLQKKKKKKKGGGNDGEIERKRCKDRLICRRRGNHAATKPSSFPRARVMYRQRPASPFRLVHQAR